MPGRGTKAVSSSLTGNYTSLSEGLMALINRLMSLRTASIDCIDRTPLDAVQQTECADSEEEIRRLISKKKRCSDFSGHRFSNARKVASET